jgi:hypothetical protein
MKPYTIQTSVNDYLSTNWTATSIRIINKDDAPALPFIECHYNPGQTFGLEINGYAERTGVFMINVFTSLDVGLDEGWTYAGMIETLFWHKIIDNHIICENGFLMPYSSNIGIDDSLQSYQIQVVIPFSIISED